MPPSVLLTLDKLVERHTGLERFSFDLAHALSEVGAADVALVYLAPRRRWSELRPSRATLLPLVRYKMEKVQAPVRRLDPSKGQRRGKPRYAVWHALAQDAKYWPWDPRTPMVLTVHDLTVRQVYHGEKLAAQLRRIQRNIDRSDIILTVSHFSADEIREHFEIGGRPVEVIYHGVTLDPGNEGQRPARMTDEPFLFAIGRLVSYKNLVPLVAMMERLPDERLVIAGDQSDGYAEQVRQAIAASDARDRITLLGSVSEPERAWLFRHAAALLQPSLAEGFGLPVIEAMSCGVPVFAARRTCLPEIGGPLAFYWDTFEPDVMAHVFAEGMAMVARAPDYPSRLRAHAAQFSWRRAAEAHLDVYRSLL